MGVRKTRDLTYKSRPGIRVRGAALQAGLQCSVGEWLAGRSSLVEPLFLLLSS